MSNQNSYASIISNSGFRSLWINQILVQIATNTLNFALIVWVFKLIGSNVAVSAVILAIYLPCVIFGIFAGIVADMVDRRKIIIVVDILLVITFISFIFVKQSFPLLLLDAFILNTLAQFFMPSESSSIPLLVSKKQLFLANSLFSLTLYGSIMVGFSIGGPIFNNLGLNAVFILGAIMLFVAFILAQNLPVMKAKDRRFNHFFSSSNLKWLINLTATETRETIEFIKSKLTVSAAIWLLALVQGIVGMLAVMLPSYMENVLGIHAADSSYIVMLPLGLGMVVGAFIVGRHFSAQPRRSLVIPSVLGSGLIFVLVGLAPALAEYFQSPELPSRIIRLRYFFTVPSLSIFFALGAFCLGFCSVSIIISCQTVLQEYTSHQNRGKIFAVLMVFMTAIASVPIVFTGIFSDIFGVTPIFLGIGGVILLVGLLAMRPNLFFSETSLPFKIREFLGLGHWAKEI